MAKILHIFRAPSKRLPMEELEVVRLIVDYGLEGCAHGRPGERQVLLVDRETLEAMELAPGIIRENITTDGINVNSLALEQELRVGEARLRVSAVCHPCDQLEKIRPGLRREMRGRRGMLCRVVKGGTIRCGDVVERVSSAAEASTPAESSGSGLFAQ